MPPGRQGVVGVVPNGAIDGDQAELGPKLRLHPARPGREIEDRVKVIASGYATVESQSSWMAAGAMGFLAKPYRVQDVASKLREVLDRATGRTA